MSVLPPTCSMPSTVVFSGDLASSTALSVLDSVFQPVYTRSGVCWPSHGAPALQESSLAAAFRTVAEQFLPKLVGIAGVATNQSLSRLCAEFVFREEGSTTHASSATLLATSALVQEAATALPASRAGEEPYVLVARATSGAGGELCIELATHHNLFDGRGHFAFLRAWADQVRTGSFVKPLVSRSVLDGQVSPALGVIDSADARSFGIVPLAEIIAKAGPRSPHRFPLLTSRFLISAAAIDHMRGTASPSASADRIRTNDVVCALIWRAITRARLKAAAKGLISASPTTRLGFAVDIRKRCVPPLPEEYVGNATLFGVTGSISTDRFQGAKEDSLSFAETCSLVHAAKATATDSDHIRRALGYMASSPSPCHVDFFGSADGTNSDVAITNWTRIPGCADCDFGFGPPAEVAVPDGSSDGVVILLPHCKRSGDIVAHVQLIKPVMELLLGELKETSKDCEWAAFATTYARRAFA